ncbi:MAG: hypothetical protein H0U16_05580 [Actinobacteria bacterium]|nr:hypothetical protein [Actinomycetota bacterium]
MEAQAWTAIALLAASLISSLFYLGNRIDGLGNSLGNLIDALGSRIDALDNSLNSRIDGLSGRIDALEARLDARIDGLTSEVRAQSARIGRLEEQGALLAGRIYELAVKLDDHLRRHAG